MEQSLIEWFNQTTAMTVYCKERIKNLVVNAKYGKVSILTEPNVVIISFATTRKGKPAQIMAYTINREHLTAEQLSELIAASLPKEKK